MITSYDHLSIGKYQDILAILKNSTGKEEIQTQAAILAVLTDLTPACIMALPLVEYAKLAEGMKFLQKEQPQASRLLRCSKVEIETPEEVKGITKDKGRIVLIPTKRIEDITVAQFVDFEHFSAPEQIAERLSCLLVPEGHTYSDGYDIKALTQVIRDGVTMPQAGNLTAFFLRRFSAQGKDMATYLARIVKTLQARRTRMS